MSQPVLPSATIAAGPCARQAITGRPQAIASTRTSPNASATEGRTSASAAFSACGSCSWGRQPARKTCRLPIRRAVASGCSPSHSPGWPPTSTSGTPVSGWQVALASGSLGEPGEPTHAASFYEGVEVAAVDYEQVVAEPTEQRDTGTAAPGGLP